MGKKLYITTAIPYVNANIHIGNILDQLYADIWSRYQKQNGHDVRFQVGTDEHGNKIAVKAAEANLTPKAYADKMVTEIQHQFQLVDIKYTDFIRTTDAHHEAAIQWIWQQLQPYIYKGKYEGWYCTGHEAFFTDKEVQANNGICPDHKTPYERLSEENYYLKASAFSDKVREAIESNRMEIVPEFRKKEFLELMKDGLKDVSISRPKKNLSWGVPVPGDPEQVMYVWLDALANYITVLGFPDHPEWAEYWPAEIQFIGKDILRFHAGIWPPMLIGLNVPLPKKLLVHGFVNIDSAKISKTVGNVISPSDVIGTYGLDAFRYFMSRHIPTQDDGDFTWEKFENAYNNELGNDLGNLVQRVSAMITRYQVGVIGDAPQAEHDMKPYREAMDNLTFNEALDAVWANVRSLNQYLESVKPWEVAKEREKDSEAESHLSEILATAVGTLLQIADMLVPFMPNTADYIHKLLGTGVIVDQGGVMFPKIYKHTPNPHGPATPAAPVAPAVPAPTLPEPTPEKEA